MVLEIVSKYVNLPLLQKVTKQFLILLGLRFKKTLSITPGLLDLAEGMKIVAQKFREKETEHTEHGEDSEDKVDTD